MLQNKMAEIKLFGPLGLLVKSKVLTYEAETVKDVFDSLIAEYPVMRAKLFGEDGEFKKFIKVYIGNEDINLVNGIETKVTDKSQISVLYAIAGG